MSELVDYRFTLKYRPGSANRDAEFLSRRPKPIEEIIQKCTEECKQDVMESISKALEIEKRGEIDWISMSPVIQWTISDLSKTWTQV